MAILDGSCWYMHVSPRLQAPMKEERRQKTEFESLFSGASMRHLMMKIEKGNTPVVVNRGQGLLIDFLFFALHGFRVLSNVKFLPRRALGL